MISQFFLKKVFITVLIFFFVNMICFLVSGSTISSIKGLPRNLKWFLKEGNSKKSEGSGRVILELTGMVERSKLLVYAILWLTEGQFCLLWTEVVRQGKRSWHFRNAPSPALDFVKYSEVSLSPAVFPAPPHPQHTSYLLFNFKCSVYLLSHYLQLCHWLRMSKC